MTQVRTARRPPTTEELERAFRAETKRGFYFILPEDHVWAILQDEESHYVLTEDYPGEVTAEFERRLRQQAEPKFIDVLRSHTAARLVYQNLSEEKSARDFYEYVLKKLLKEASERKGGVNSLTLHFLISNGSVSTLPSVIADDLRTLLKEEGFRLYIGSAITRDGSGQASMHIDWTIFWYW